MTAADLNELTLLRAKAKELKSAIRTELKIIHKAWKSEDYDAVKRSRNKINDMKDQRDELFEAVVPPQKNIRKP